MSYLHINSEKMPILDNDVAINYRQVHRSYGWRAVQERSYWILTGS